MSVLAPLKSVLSETGHELPACPIEKARQCSASDVDSSSCDHTLSDSEGSQGELSVTSHGSNSLFVSPPLVGFGTFNEFKDHESVAAAVRTAIAAGYRHFDLASLYGNESEVGAAINGAIQAGEILREELWICGKLWCNDQDPADVESACRLSLEKLGLEYFDNYMLHWPVRWTKGSHLVTAEHGGQFNYSIVHSGDRAGIASTYKAMERLVTLGLTRTLGVSNCNIRILEDLMADCNTRPICNEVELHPYLRQQGLVEFCKSKGIHLVAYSPLGKVGYRNPGDPSILEDPTVLDIARQTGRSPGQVVLRWNVQRGVCVVPKSLTAYRIAANIDILAWSLSEQQMSQLDGLDCGFRFCRPPWYDFTASDAEGLAQPALKQGHVDEESGIYYNSFERQGRRLASNIIVKRGILRELETLGRNVIPEACHHAKNYIVTDNIVDPIYGDQVLNGLRAAGFNVEKIVVLPDAEAVESNPTGEVGEFVKTRRVFNDCVDSILSKGISKHSCVISLGGGVINNMCGVIAATLYRGIALVHITTTSMGMMDASLDFKQAINHELGKNLLGTYYPATNIVIDPDCLATLPKRHVLNGIAEALKHGLTQSRDLTEAITKPLRLHGDNILRDGDYLETITRHSIETKAPTLDNYEQSDFNEACPQYGHSIGHAIEHISWSGEPHEPLLHGEAVCIGMAVSAEVALIMGLCHARVITEHYDYLQESGFPVYVPATIDINDIVAKMAYDKHTVKVPHMGLTSDIGQMAVNENGGYFFEVGTEILTRALERNVARRKAHSSH